jgi:hypothetical protein
MSESGGRLDSSEATIMEFRVTSRFWAAVEFTP